MANLKKNIIIFCMDNQKILTMDHHMILIINTKMEWWWINPWTPKVIREHSQVIILKVLCHLWLKCIHICLNLKIILLIYSPVLFKTSIPLIRTQTQWCLSKIRWEKWSLVNRCNYHLINLFYLYMPKICNPWDSPIQTCHNHRNKNTTSIFKLSLLFMETLPLLHMLKWDDPSTQDHLIILNI